MRYNERLADRMAKVDDRIYRESAKRLRTYPQDVLADYRSSRILPRINGVNIHALRNIVESEEAEPDPSLKIRPFIGFIAM